MAWPPTTYPPLSLLTSGGPARFLLHSLPGLHPACSNPFPSSAPPSLSMSKTSLILSTAPHTGSLFSTLWADESTE